VGSTFGLFNTSQQYHVVSDQSGSGTRSNCDLLCEEILVVEVATQFIREHSNFGPDAADDLAERLSGTSSTKAVVDRSGKPYNMF